MASTLSVLVAYRCRVVVAVVVRVFAVTVVPILKEK